MITLPTQFTAVNGITGPINSMIRSFTQFGNAAGTAGAQATRAFSVFGGTLNDVQGEIFAFTKRAALVSAIGAGVGYTGKAMMEFEDAVAGFRTVVSELNDTQFNKFREQIRTVALDTRKSSIEVAQSFELIAGLNEKFAETATGLGAVSKAAITMSKAARMALPNASENLVETMNTFQLGPEMAMRAVNVMAAGKRFGASEISQTSEALQRFGAQAYAANISIEQSTALIQVLAAQGKKGSDAGTALSAVLGRLQAAGLGYRNGVFNINTALDDLQNRYKSLGTEQLRSAYLTNLLGQEHKNAGIVLLAGIEQYKYFEKAVTGTNEAERAAAINTNTLSNRLSELRNKWINITTTAPQAGSAMAKASKIVQFLTDHLDGVVTVLGLAVSGFIAYKAYMIGSMIVTKTMTAATLAYQFVMGAAAAVTGTMNTNLLLFPAHARGFSIGMAAMNTSAKGLLVTLGSIAAVTVAVLGAFEMIQQRNRSKARLQAILPNLPKEVDKEKFKAEYMAYEGSYFGGFAKNIAKATGRQSDFSQNMIDSLGKKFYDEPMRIQDSVMNAISNMPIVFDQQQTLPAAMPTTVVQQQTSQQMAPQPGEAPNGNVTVTFVDMPDGAIVSGGNKGISIQHSSTRPKRW